MRHSHCVTDRLRYFALAAVVAVAAACGGSRHGANAKPPAVLYFSNESLDQADVFAVLSGLQSVRIGTVMPGQTDTLVVPSDISSRAENINLVARLLARSGTPQSGPIAIHPGDQLEVRLPVDAKQLVVLPARP